MQFKHPELLYALFLLLIPIIVHLFQLRKFKKVAFTNVAFLKEATLQTRKSSQIKKWLILFTRLLLFTAIILAFAQPFIAKTDSFNQKKETVIYLDNSFSMQAKGNKGELLKRAIQDLISNIPEEENVSLVTNNQIYKNTTIKAIKNELLQLNYSANAMSLQSALLKCKTLLNKNKDVLNTIVFISDFQQSEESFIPLKDSLSSLHLVKLEPVNTNNIAIDSTYISSATAGGIELTVTLKNNGDYQENVPVSLYNDNNLIAKTSMALDKAGATTFTLPVSTIINGKIVIDDASLAFDNELFFNINTPVKTNVLSINKIDDSYLKRIFTDQEFNYLSTDITNLNYNDISNQSLIILNELDNIPTALASAMLSFNKDGGSILVIPSNDISNQSYNTFLSNYNITLSNIINTEKRITSIKYSHPLYNNGVFEKEVSNFQYPKVNNYYDLVSNKASTILELENGASFLSQNSNVFVFTASIASENSNFKNSPLIVPTLFNIGKFSLKNPNLYFTIGKTNSFDVTTQLQQDDILSLVNNNANIIPQQQQFSNKIVVTTLEMPSISGIYNVKNKASSILNVSYNYNRNESDLVYQNLSNFDNVKTDTSITNVFNSIKSDTKVNALWKWFVIFALALLIIEMLILKYFK
ncbi:BatA and WFA domain-containing protein [uncultured Algibacter sp.]|uniref:vWA domain-containing protein n=1 Tax=uncultured Algibacter sp. TaxID=298659 RepID=UPI00260DE91C|nr:BatA and WFA domain-containing protein [uncultured Algibacter sp.]